MLLRHNPHYDLKTGVDVICVDEVAVLRGRKIGALSNHTSTLWTCCFYIVACHLELVGGARLFTVALQVSIREMTPSPPSFVNSCSSFVYELGLIFFPT